MNPQFFLKNIKIKMIRKNEINNIAAIKKFRITCARIMGPPCGANRLASLHILTILVIKICISFCVNDKIIKPYKCFQK